MNNKKGKILSVMLCVVMVATVFAVAGSVNAGASEASITKKLVAETYHIQSTHYSSTRLIVRDSSDALYVALLFQEPQGILKVLKSVDQGNTWTFIPDPEFSGVIGKSYALAINSKDHLHLVVHDYSGSKHFFHREFDGTSWLPKEQFSDTPFSGGLSPMTAVDSQDNLHVVWQNPSGNNYHREKAAGTWLDIETIGNIGRQTSLAIDYNDDLHVVGGYLNALLYQKCTAGIWGPIETIDPLWTSRHASIAIDSTNQPHVTWTSDGYNQGWRTYYSMRTTAGWQPRTQLSVSNPDPTQDLFANSVIAIDTDDNIFIMYVGVTPEEEILLYYVKRMGLQWFPEVIITEPEQMAIDPQLRWSSWPTSNRVQREGDLDLVFLELISPSYPVMYNHGVAVAIPATIDIDPDTLRLTSKGKFVTCYIELPEGYYVEDIDLDSVTLTEINDGLLDPPLYTVGTFEIRDYDDDGIPDLMVKFDRQELSPLLEVGDAELTVSGELIDGPMFEGTDTITLL